MYVAPRFNVHVLEPELTDRYWDAYAAADVLCQPSQLESFAITLMEGWLCGTPALVHPQCQVTREHAERCSGGLWFGDSEEFSTTLDWLLTHPQTRTVM